MMFMRRRVGIGSLAILLALLACGCGKDKQAGDGGAAAKSPATSPAADEPRKFDGEPSDDPGSWPQFRGAARDDIAADAKELFRTWPGGGPKVLWKIEGLGEGYSGPAVASGRVFFNDYDMQKKEWSVRCVSLADGKDIWQWSYGVRIPRNHGVTRTVPAADDCFVVSLDPLGTLHGIDATTGKQLWKHDLFREYGSVVPEWYNGQCPLNETDRVIVAVGGTKEVEIDGRKQTVLMAAFDKASGKVLWATPNASKHSMSHPSVMPMTLDGKFYYVWTSMVGMVGVTREGTLAWEVLWPKADTPGQWRAKTAVAPSPVQVGPDRIFQTSSYRAGSAMFRVAGGQVQTLWTINDDQFNSDTHTPIVVGDRLFATYAEKQFCCIDPADGRIVWQGPKDRTVGLGPYLMADGLIYVLEADGGHLDLIEASAEGWKELARARVLPDNAQEAWAPMALVNGKLICRDLGTMVCLQVGPQQPPVKPAGTP
ncbi:MAG: Outer membrane protein assembly factor BamB [Phycisphaerae bacterium]|nr:Outer membrane protein assembly factor BamB [Phycisphaerae bacterium]